MSRADAAKVAGIHPSTLSRIMSDELGASVENVAMLLRAVPDASDRLHCLREYLFDETPDAYRDELIISFEQLDEKRPRLATDSLRGAIHALELAATTDRDLRRLIVDLAAVLARPHTVSAEDVARAYEEERESVQKTVAMAGKPTSTRRKRKRAVRRSDTAEVSR
jgi:hypothetical protein